VAAERRRIPAPTSPKPAIISVQVPGSGTVLPMPSAAVPVNWAIAAAVLAKRVRPAAG